MSTAPTPAPTTLDQKTIELVNLVVKTTLVEMNAQATAAPTAHTVAPDSDAERASNFALQRAAIEGAKK
jgi:hypothetical protein